MRMNIRIKVLAILLGITMLPLLVIQWVVHDQFQTYAQNMFTQNARHHREVASIYIQTLFTDSQKAIDLMIKNIHLVYGPNQTPLVDQMTTLLSVVRDSVDYVPNFYIGTETGQFFLYPPDILPIGYDPRKRNWYQQANANQNQVNWIGPYIDQGTKTLVMTVSKKFEYKGASGVVGLDIILDSIRESIKNKKVGEKGNLFLMDQNGKIIMHQQSMLEGIDIALTKYRDEGVMTALKTGHNESKHYIVDALPVNDALYIVTVIDKAEINTLIEEQIQRLTLIMYGFIALTALLALYLSGSLSRPFKGLVKAMEQVRQGDYSVQFFYNKHDEIGDLANGFNDMVQHYKQNSDEMSALYEELYASEETLMEQYDELLHRKNVIEASEERYRLIFDASIEGIWEVNDQMVMSFLSKNWFKPFNLPENTGTFEDWTKLIHPDDLNIFSDHLTEHLNGKIPFFSLEYRVIDAKGHIHWVHTKAKALLTDEKALLKMAGSNVDITERKNYEDQTVYLAYYDTLTQLPNMANLTRKLETEMGRHNWGQLFFIDINNFKYVNDSFGHSVGDQLILQLVDRLKRNFPEAFIARTGGDEFVLLFDTIYDGFSLSQLGHKLQAIAVEPYLIDNITTHVTISIITSKFPHDAKTPEELYKNIDLTLYYVKTKNISSLQAYDDAIRQAVSARMYIESNLERALNNDEFVLYYQPIIKIQDNQTFQFEALIRWNDSNRGLVPPGEFIGAAETTGAIIHIGRWVLHETCRFQRQLLDEFGVEISMSINVSVSQLNDNRFVEEIQKCLELYDIPTHLLAIEITESMMSEQMEDLQDRLRRLRALGVKIALDDFGKGFSSLNHLISLPLDLLKIDKEITSKINTDEHVKALYESIIHYAHKIGVDVIVEGIETPAQSDQLEKMQCDYLQGYLFSKPIPSELVFRYIQRKL